MKINKRAIGKYGEEIAEKYLKKNKYEIICKNFYTRMGEVDLIAIKDKYLIFIEVKSRKNKNYGSPAMAVNENKIRHMKIAARVFLKLNKFSKYNIRFDVIEIYFLHNKWKVNHIKQII